MKRWHTAGLVLMLCALPASAQTPQNPPPPGTAPAADQAMTPVERPTIGRLFFTPEERARLDDMRRRPTAPPAPQVAEAKPEAAPPPQPPVPQYITLNGIVRRSDGSTTVWINNKPVTGARSDDGIVVAPAARAGAIVRVPRTGRSVELKVGQQLEVLSGQVQEAYESPRAVAAATAPEAKPAEAAPVAPPAPVRRSSRERDLLRDLLREIEGTEAAGKPTASPPGTPGKTP